LAGFAGVLEAMILGSGNPEVGPPFLLPAFAAAFLGATTIRPGQYNVFGAVVSVFLIATGGARLQLMGAPFYLGPMFRGGALLVAVFATRVISIRESGG